jgi:hypothetical protein
VVLRGGRILQGGVPYRADLAFDVDKPDAVTWGCAEGADGGPSRIVEVGDARFLAAGREVDASGSVLVPALTASVRGLAARRWLTPRALDDMGRLGVGLLRWHVLTRDIGFAQSAVAALVGPGRPAIEIVGARAALSPLVVSRPPRKPVSRTLGDFVVALGTWKDVPASPAPIPLAPDAPASFLVLRGGDADGLDARKLEVDAVYIDGRQLSPPSDRLNSR